MKNKKPKLSPVIQFHQDKPKKYDPVNSPKHYTSGNIEVIDFIEDKKLGFNLGNAIKYIARAGKKDPATKKQDLEKAIWYLNREILNTPPQLINK